MSRLSLLLIGLTLAMSSRADAACPDGPNGWATYGMLPLADTWDAPFARVWCGRYDPATGAISIPDLARLEGVISHVYSALPYDDDFDSWWNAFIAGVYTCNPMAWGTRYFNGMYFLDYLGDVRAHSPVDHTRTPIYIYQGQPVVHWLVDFVGLAEEDDVRFECLHEDDMPGDDRRTFAGNASGLDMTLYYPWYWDQTVVGRASTVVHEAVHEFIGHLDDSACAASASCDGAFNSGEANAQTVQIFFLAQAIDAWVSDAEGEPELVYFPDGTCGYVPLLPDAIRESTRVTMARKLNQHFQSAPAEVDWPDAARESISPIGNTTARYNLLDLTIGARWECDHVCAVDDFDYAAFGYRACDERLKALNVQVNADNRAVCAGLQDLVEDGATPFQLKIYGELLEQQLRPCVPGVDEEVVDAHCDDLIAGAQHIDDIAAGWALVDQGYHFDAQAAIAACEQRYCDDSPRAEWLVDAQAACFEWDDPRGCLERACGALAAAGPRESLSYLEAVACRADAIVDGFADAFASHSPCAEQYSACVLAERHFQDWLAYVAGGACWRAPGDGSVFSGEAVSKVGTLSYDDFVAAAGGVGPFLDACLIQRTACDAQNGLVVRFIGDIARGEIRDGPEPRWKPKLPDRFQTRTQRYTRELFEEVADLAEAYPLLQDTPLQSPRVQALTRPEARVGLAAVFGHDAWFRMVGPLGAEGVFSPRRITAFARGGEPDPYAPDHAAHAARIERLAALRLEAERIVAAAPPEAFGRANAARIHDALTAIADARDEDQLDRALVALAGVLGAD